MIKRLISVVCLFVAAITTSRADLESNQLIGFGIARGNWQTVAGPITGDGDSGGWNGYTIRVVIDSAQLSFPSGANQIRVTFYSASGEGLIITSAYVQNGAAAGDAYDFDSTPSQLLFGGSASRTIGANSNATSDGASFTRIAGRSLVVSLYINGGTSADAFRSKGTQTGYTSYYINSSDATTVNTTGYSTAVPAILGVMHVEAIN